MEDSFGMPNSLSEVLNLSVQFVNFGQCPSIQSSTMVLLSILALRGTSLIDNNDKKTQYSH